MRIYDKTGEVLLDIPVDDDSYRYRAIAQAKKVELRYSLVDHVELPTGAYIEYQGERYTLWYPSDFKKEGTRVLDYTVTFGGNEEILKKYKYKLLSDKPYKLKFVMTATPRMFMELLVDNLNLYDSGWTVGTVIEAPEKLLGCPWTAHAGVRYRAGDRRKDSSLAQGGVLQGRTGRSQLWQGKRFPSRCRSCEPRRQPPR